jgi:phenylacetate-CoA ligase
MYWAKEIETMPREQLRTLQEKRLKSQLDYVYKNSSFYRNKFDGIGFQPGDFRTLEDFPKLPFTTKEELRESQSEKPPYGVHICIPWDEIAWAPMTSGTTGVPLILPRNLQDIETWTDLNARAFTCAGVGKGDILQNVFSYHFIYSGLIMHPAAQRVGATVLNTGMGNTDRQLWVMTHFGTTVLVATPSYFNYLGNKIREKNLQGRIKVRIAHGGGEIGVNTAQAKNRIRELFPTVGHVADGYGVTDIGTIIWIDCPEECGGHIWEDSVYPEVLSPETLQPVPPKEPGELVLTDLVGKTAPLIRYRIKDLVAFDPEPCSCGRTLGRFPGGVIDRIDHMVTVRSANIYPSMVESVIKEIPLLTGEYMIIVDRPHDLDLLLIQAEFKTGADTRKKELEEKIKSGIRTASGISAEVELIPEGTLPRFVYKAMRVIDKRKGQSIEDAFRKAAEQGKL